MSDDKKIGLFDYFYSLEFWFSPKGRINRKPFFFSQVLIAGIFYLIENYGSDDLVIYSSLLLIYIFIALGIKRWHDRGRRGWLIIFSFIPIINIWPVIELFLLKGESGDNKYGPDPLGYLS